MRHILTPSNSNKFQKIMKIAWFALAAALCAVARAHTRWAAPVPRSLASGLKTVRSFF